MVAETKRIATQSTEAALLKYLAGTAFCFRRASAHFLRLSTLQLDPQRKGSTVRSLFQGLRRIPSFGPVFCDDLVQPTCYLKEFGGSHISTKVELSYFDFRYSAESQNRFSLITSVYPEDLCGISNPFAGFDLFFFLSHCLSTFVVTHLRQSTVKATFTSATHTFS